MIKKTNRKEKMAKTINVDRGSFLGKKDVALEEYVSEWVAWSLQLTSIISDSDDVLKFYDLKSWVKELAEKSFEKVYQEQQIEWLKKLKEKEDLEVEALQAAAWKQKYPNGFKNE